MRSRGFTLVEAVLALGITTIVLTTLMQGQSDIQRRARLDLPTVEWYLMLHELENPAHHFAFKVKSKGQSGGADHNVHLKNTDNGKLYDLNFIHGPRKLRLINSTTHGQIVMMENVHYFHATPDHHLTLITTNGEVFTAKLLLPDYIEKGDAHAQAPRHVTPIRR